MMAVGDELMADGWLLAASLLASCIVALQPFQQLVLAQRLAGAPCYACDTDLLF
jgi:hypothetical protein